MDWTQSLPRWYVVSGLQLDRRRRKSLTAKNLTAFKQFPPSALPILSLQQCARHGLVLKTQLHDCIYRRDRFVSWHQSRKIALSYTRKTRNSLTAKTLTVFKQFPPSAVPVWSVLRCPVAL